MPKNNCVTKATTANPYRVDDRATIKKPLGSTSVNVANGPTRSIISGVRVNAPASGLED